MVRYYYTGKRLCSRKFEECFIQGSWLALCTTGLVGTLLCYYICDSSKGNRVLSVSQTYFTRVSCFHCVSHESYSLGSEETHLLGILLFLYMDREGRDPKRSHLNCVLWLRKKYMLLPVYYRFISV